MILADANRCPTYTNILRRRREAGRGPDSQSAAKYGRTRRTTTKSVSAPTKTASPYLARSAASIFYRQFWSCSPHHKIVGRQCASFEKRAKAFKQRKRRRAGIRNEIKDECPLRPCLGFPIPFPHPLFGYPRRKLNRNAIYDSGRLHIWGKATTCLAAVPYLLVPT